MPATMEDADSPFFSTEHRLLRDTLRRFVDEKVRPQAEGWESAGMVPREVLREMGALGLLGIRYPARFGGGEMDTLGSVVLAEELGRSSFGGFAITVLVHTDMASPHLARAGSAAQTERWLPELIAGRKICAVAMTEADAGSDLAGMRSTARRDGGGWVLNGSKMFITNGVHADLYIVAAKTGEPGRNRQMSMFLVERGTPGFSVGAVAAQDRLAVQRHSRAGVRGLPVAGRRAARRRRAGLQGADAQPAERAHRHRRDGGGRSRARDRADAASG